MEASGSDLFNNFSGEMTTDSSLYETNEMDWNQVISTSTSVETPEQGAIQDFGAEELQPICTGIQEEHIGIQEEHTDIQLEDTRIQQEHAEIQQEHNEVQQRHTVMQQGHSETPGDCIGLQQVYSGMQQEDIGEQQELIGVQQEHIGMQKECIKIQSTSRKQVDDIKIQEDDFRTQKDDFRLQEVDFKLKKSEVRPQEGDIRPQEGDIRPQEGDIRPQEGVFRPQKGVIRLQKSIVRTHKGDFRPQKDDLRSQDNDCRMQVEETPICFYNKVSFLMYAFGDVISPLNESIWLMHNILESQMGLLIRNCEDVMKIRGGEKISHEDVLFLMRRNKVLLRRFLQYLYLQDFNTYLLPGFAEYRGNTVIPIKGDKVQRCLEFLHTIEKFTGDLTHLLSDKNVYDCVLQKRLKRRYSILNSETDGKQKYFEFTLRTLFHHPSSDLYKKWLLQCSKTRFDIDPLAISVIHFLTIETVAGLIEKALYMRSRKKEEKKDLLFPLLDFNCPINQYDYSDDDGSEDNFNATTSEIDKYSYKPRKYLKELNCYLNNEKKIDDEGTFYQDSMLAILPKIVLLPNSSQPNYMPSDFIQSNENPPLNLLTKTDYETDSISKNPITPQEIRNAFIHYQRLKPMTVLLKTKLPYSKMRKTRLVCLAFPDEEFEEDA